MINRYLVTIITVLSISFQAFSQRPHSAGQYGGERPSIGVVTGQVLTTGSKLPLQCANVILYSLRDSTQAYGTTSDKTGRFEISAIRVGAYFAKASFMSYESVEIPEFRFRRGNIEIDLGKIYIQPTIANLEGVEVTVDRPEEVFKIDKKVINVSKQISVTSGTAIDVLESAPSVTVDIDGNVRLRGSSSFTVLIDGIPSMLDPSDALQQIPVSTIEDIEIIFNPSAKHDPDGVAGIINVLLKRNKLQGYSGSLNTNNGQGERYGGDFLISYKNDNFGYLIGIDLNKRLYARTVRNESRTYTDESILYVNSNGTSPFAIESQGIRGTLDYDLNSSDKIRLGFKLGERSMELVSAMDFEEWSSSGETTDYYSSESRWGRTGKSISANFDYIHGFAHKGHKLTGHVSYSDRDGDEEAIAELYSQDGMKVSGNQSTEKGPGIRYRIKLDYTLPFEENARFETGYQSRLGVSKDVTTMGVYDPINEKYLDQPEFDHETEYTRNIHSLYMIYANEMGKLGFQAGFRGEYTDRMVETIEAEKFSIDRTDLFPTAHFSYQLSDRNQLMTSYARRIERPRGWYLEPFDTWNDAYNVRVGNPELLPEYIDSYELSYQTKINRSTFTAEAYYRETENKIERVQSVYPKDDTVILHSTENVGTERAIGTEYMLNMKPMKAWSFNVSANIFDYQVDGALNEEDFSNKSSNWSGRMSNDFQLSETLRLQVNGKYTSASASSQGRAVAYSTLDVALKYDFIPKMLTATFQIRDILQTGNQENTYNSSRSYIYNHVDREAPLYILNINYIFNNYQRDRGGERNGGMGDDEKF